MASIALLVVFWPIRFANDVDQLWWLCFCWVIQICGLLIMGFGTADLLRLCLNAQSDSNKGAANT